MLGARGKRFVVLMPGSISCHSRSDKVVLRAKTYTIPLYGLFVRLRLLPTRENIENAAGCLIGMSNMLYDNATRASLDRDKLGLEASESLGIRHYKSKP